MPILAKREANLVLNRYMGEPFGSVTDKGRFGVLEVAHCRTPPSYGKSRKRHSFAETPHVACQCGFYAIPPDAWSDYAEPWRVTLLVELSGVVIEHDYGYRAQYQKVVECQISPCMYCGRAADFALVADTMNVWRFVCAAHTTSLQPGHLHLDIDSLQHRIGVPVTRLELP